MFETAKPFLLSLALGLMLGIERERSFRGDHASLALGARTFALIALLGTISAHLAVPAISAVLAAFVVALTIAAYVRPAGPAAGPAGTTTEVAAVATFGLGFLAHGEPRLAAMIGGRRLATSTAPPLLAMSALAAASYIVLSRP